MSLAQPLKAHHTVAVPLEGIHILSNFTSSKERLLYSFEPFREFIDAVINTYQLTKVGEAYHNFEGGGFTGVVCLSESHLSIHTWPDRSYATFDVFLSNYSKNNESKAKGLYDETCRFFKAEVVFENSIYR